MALVLSAIYCVTVKNSLNAECLNCKEKCKWKIKSVMMLIIGISKIQLLRLESLKRVGKYTPHKHREVKYDYSKKKLYYYSLCNIRSEMISIAH